MFLHLFASLQPPPPAPAPKKSINISLDENLKKICWGGQQGGGGAWDGGRTLAFALSKMGTEEDTM